MAAYVFNATGVYQAPARCSRYWSLRAKYLALVREAERQAQTQAEATCTEQLTDARQMIFAHLEMCGDCQGWLAAVERGAGLVALSESDAAKVWQSLDRGGRP